MSDLMQVGLEHKADKAYHAHYLPLYQRYLAGRRVEAMLELGVLHGASLRMWLAWFLEACVTGVDKELEPLPDLMSHPRCRLLEAAQDDPRLPELAGPADLIVDDAGHEPEAQRRSLELLWPCLRAGGLYVIEDVESSFWVPLNQDAHLREGCILPYLKGLTDDLHSGYGHRGDWEWQPDGTAIPGKSVMHGCFPRLEGLIAVHHHENIVFLEKK